MEILIVLGLVLAAAVYLAIRSNRPGDTTTPQSQSGVHEKPRLTTNQRQRTSQSERFDPDHTVPKPDVTILAGSAYVVDGDTLVIKKTQVRLFGVDAPEINHPYGKKAKWALVSLCKGQKIRAEVTEQDTHGRTVAKCYLEDGRDLSAEMVKLGLAIDWPKFSGGQYRSMEMPDARKKLWLANARQNGHMGLWKQYDAKQAARKMSN
ncbi:MULTISPECIES: thermonuclease family protein [unclassified Ruegeria]|uniref:thermonuclease family protein n=1 Tax=unclassified Ruegeria TaxID=2625375 RepID=UPI001489DA10|nr:MULTISPECIES: thermonuclease family protein [unclassified Ruegeria]